jgi:hypothetical protein
VYVYLVTDPKKLSQQFILWNNRTYGVMFCWFFIIKSDIYTES